MAQLGSQTNMHCIRHLIKVAHDHFTEAAHHANNAERTLPAQKMKIEERVDLAWRRNLRPVRVIEEYGQKPYTVLMRGTRAERDAALDLALEPLLTKRSGARAIENATISVSSRLLVECSQYIKLIEDTLEDMEKVRNNKSPKDGRWRQVEEFQRLYVDPELEKLKLHLKETAQSMVAEHPRIRSSLTNGVLQGA